MIYLSKSVFHSAKCSINTSSVTPILFLISSSIACAGVAQAQELYKDEKAPMHERIMDLLSRLTVEEKISLLRATSPGISRLDIPKYYHGNEALHGVVRPGRFTVFPQAIGLAATWNPELQLQVATVISDEARARWNELDQGREQKSQFSDLLTFWSPTVNMARDPRWGRTPETYGEDPYLSGIMGTAFVKGLQGDDDRYLKIVSTPKHFAANNEEHNRFVSVRKQTRHSGPDILPCSCSGFILPTKQPTETIVTLQFRM